MNTQFVKKSNKPFVAKPGLAIICPHTDKKFVVYDEVRTEGDKVEYSISDGNRKQFYTSEGKKLSPVNIMEDPKALILESTKNKPTSRRPRKKKA